MSGGADLSVPLGNNEQHMLMKQTSFLTELPKFTATETGISKAERVREWRHAVDQKLAALHPVFKEYWIWSWLVGDLFYQHWVSLGADARAALCVTAPVPPRYAWIENLFKDKIVQALPARQQAEYRGEHRAGKVTAVHGLLCQLSKYINLVVCMTSKA